MRIAVIADVHGNLPALDAVLADIARRSVEQIVNLGDLLSGGVDPLGTADRLMPLRLPTVCGNHERQVLSDGPMGASDNLARNAIGPKHRRWLRSLPPTIAVAPGVLAFHGTPTSDTTYLLETVEPLGVRPAYVGEVRARLGKEVDWDLMLCGHTHIQRVFQLPAGPLIVNPGSVGWPAYDDSSPTPHLMESGSPHARYAVVDDTSGRWKAELVALDYDWQRAAATAEVNARTDVAQQLRTGFAVFPASRSRPVHRRLLGSPDA